MVQVENISKSYGNNQALSNVNFTLERGYIVGLLGVNGAGKSTLMKILAGIIKPDKGNVNIFGYDLQKNPLRIKKHLGYLSEDNPLYEDMYVVEYLEYVAGIYNIDKNNLVSIIEKTGLEKECRKKICMLSKGNKQRVGIAQALIPNPRFLILDEPASGLDPNQRESLNVLIKDIAKDKAILLSTHILQDVKEMCSRFILIDKGEIVANEDVNTVDSIEILFHKLTNENNS